MNVTTNGMTGGRVLKKIVEMMVLITATASYVMLMKLKLFQQLETIYGMNGIIL